MSSRPAGLPESLQSLFADAPEVATLANGLTLIFQQNLAHPVVSVQAWIKTGSIHEDRFLGSGLSHFLEHMLFKGTHKRGPGEIAREVQAFGGQINAYTAFDRTVYYIDGPAEALGRSLELLADMTLDAALPKPEVDKEREVILREIDMTLDDPDRIVSRALFATAYRDHPFRYPVIGLRPLFEKVDREILAGYYAERYQPANMVLAVAGHFERDALLREVEGTFGKAPRRHLRPVHVPSEQDQLARRESRLYGDYQTARGLLSFKIPSMRHPDAAGLDIIAAIIGSGHSGRLRQRLREELGLVHGISASAWNPGEPGLFSIQFFGSPENAAAAEEAILATCREFAQQGFTREELDKARNFACVSEVQARQTTSGMASRLGLVAALVGDIQYPEAYFRRIYALDVEELRDLADRTFQAGRLTASTLLPVTSRPAPRHSKASDALPPFQERLLPNGARLYWQRDARLPRTWLRFAGLGGPLHEPASHRGATSLLATMLTRDTEFQSAFEVSRALESGGGFMVDSSGNNTFAISVEVMPESIDTGIRALHDALFHPAFKDDTLARERAAQVAHLRELEDDILDFGRLALRRRFFGSHPFASHPCGTEESTGRIDAACLRDLHARLLAGPNAVMVLAGEFDEDTVVPQLEALLARLPAAPLAAPAIPFAGPPQPGEFSETLNREQAIVFEAYPDVGFKPESNLVADVLDELLSDMSGPLFRSVREDQSLAYFVGASRLLGMDFGCFHLYAGTHPTTTQAVYNCFDLELERIREGKVTAEELQAAVTRLKVHSRFSLQSAATRAARVSLNALFRMPVMDWLDYEARLESLTVAHLTNFANTFLGRDKRLRLTITPK